MAGYPMLPQFYSLGFHFSKYEKNTAQTMIDRNANFTKFGFPVDVLWSDIEYAYEHEYFVFDPTTFPQNKVHQLSQ